MEARAFRLIQQLLKGILTTPGAKVITLQILIAAEAAHVQWENKRNIDMMTRSPMKITFINIH
jgi:hypothetical protein